MEKYEVTIPKEVADSICEFYNENSYDILTSLTLDFLMEQGAVCIMETIGRKVITGISIYFVIQSLGNSNNILLSSKTLREASTFRTPVKLGSNTELIDEDLNLTKFRYVIFEKGTVTYPETYVKSTVMKVEGNDIQLYEHTATPEKESGYLWVMNSNGYYTLNYYGESIGRVMACIGYSNSLELRIMQITGSVNDIIHRLPELAYIRGVKKVIIPQYPKLQKIPTIDYLIFHNFGYSKYETLGISNTEVMLPWII